MCDATGRTNTSTVSIKTAESWWREWVFDSDWRVDAEKPVRDTLSGQEVEVGTSRSAYTTPRQPLSIPSSFGVLECT
ncbi:hypothetical protein VTO73DRAFT_10162 [Trametes versicolor]